MAVLLTAATERVLDLGKANLTHAQQVSSVMGGELVRIVNVQAARIQELEALTGAQPRTNTTFTVGCLRKATENKDDTSSSCSDDDSDEEPSASTAPTIEAKRKVAETLNDDTSSEGSDDDSDEEEDNEEVAVPKSATVHNSKQVAPE